MKTTKRLYSTNIAVLEQVLVNMQKNNIVEFKTQNDLYMFIEDIKFPYLNGMRYVPDETMYIPISHMPINYTPIVNWMLDRGIIVKKPGTRINSYRYVVTSLLPIYIVLNL